jgi:hypothetical protein
VPSFFARIARYGARALGDPRENRLTEITAAVVERVPGLALELALGIVAGAQSTVNDERFTQRDERRSEELAAIDEQLTAMYVALCDTPAARATTTTQVSTHSGRYVDLALRVELEPGNPSRDLLIWVEVKHGAPVHGDQLFAYERDIMAMPAGSGRLVVVVAPRQAPPREQDLPSNIPLVTWQSIARRIETWAAAQEMEQPARFLLDEYLRYLREERLMDRNKFTVEMAQAIAWRDIANDTIEELCRITRDQVESTWGPRSGEERFRTQPAFGTGYWVSYDPPNPWWDGWLEWTLFKRADQSWAFMAGATLADGATVPDEHQQTIAALSRQGFSFFRYSKNDRIYRVFDPADLVDQGSLDDQGKYLASLIVDAFGAVAAPHLDSAT